MKHGKTIQIYLADGNPRGIKIAEVTSRTIQAILIPRSEIEQSLKRNELENVGVYFLIGIDESDGKSILYIGEAEDCKQRLKQHNRSKDFWNYALIIISKTQFFTKSHVKFLEWFCYDTAKKNNRYKIDNSSIPTKPYIPESIQSDLMDNFDTIKLLVSALGYPIFDQIAKSNKQNIIICKGKDAVAKGEYTEEGLAVFKGSICNLNETKTAGPWVIGMRTKLINTGVLKEKNETLILMEDHLFSSPSAAAAVVLGRRANGWTEWKYENGKTLDEVKRKNT